MLKNKKSRSFPGIYVLLFYVLIQFGWWSYLMLELNTEIVRLKTETTLLKSNSLEETERAEKILFQDLRKKRIMIIGEGSVFLILLLLGGLRVYQTFKKETELALQQSNFLLSVTHELKSPIASARLQLETLLLRKLPAEMQETLLRNAIQDTDRLNALVENILLATKFDKSNFSLSLQKVNVSQYIVEMLKNKVFQGNPEFKLELASDVYFSIDTIHFASILLNLIDNACKYAPGKPISIQLKQLPNGMQINVVDMGPGIADAYKHRIFEKFYRIGNEATRNNKGTGLGLYIVQHLVNEHNGKIVVLDNPSGGTNFELLFYNTPSS